MVADPRHMTAQAECASKSEDSSSLLLMSAMLGMLGKEGKEVMSASVPDFLKQCYEEVKGTCPPNVPMPMYAGVIGSTYTHEQNDFLVSMATFSPEDSDMYFAKHYPTKVPKYLGIYEGFAHVHLNDKTSDAP